MRVNVQLAIASPFQNTGAEHKSLYAIDGSSSMKTESEKRKIKWFIGSLAAVAFCINSIFIKERAALQASIQPQQRALQSSKPVETGIGRVAQSTLREAAEASDAERRENELAVQQALQNAAEQHARYLARYIDSDFARKPGIGTVAIVVVSEDQKSNPALAPVLATHLKTDAVEIHSGFFKPEFISDNLFAETFKGSTDAINKLELAKSLDALLLARQEVRYSTNASLENVITATMRLEVLALPVSGTGQTQAWTFTANGAGFKPTDARSLAEERLIKQIAKDDKMSLRQVYAVKQNQ